MLVDGSLLFISLHLLSLNITLRQILNGFILMEQTAPELVNSPAILSSFPLVDNRPPDHRIPLLSEEGRDSDSCKFLHFTLRGFIIILMKRAIMVLRQQHRIVSALEAEAQKKLGICNDDCSLWGEVSRCL